MARYIDADKLKLSLLTLQNTLKACGFINGVGWVQVLNEAVDSTPTADVIEVVHAQDIAGFVHGHCEFKCSRCGADAGEIAYGSLDGAHVNYCPNCAAFIGNGTKWDGTFGGDYKAKGWEVQNDA